MASTQRVAFISGAGRNIGRAVAVKFAQKGIHVVVNGSSDRAAVEETARLADLEGVRALVLMGDVGQSAQVKDMAAAALKEFGRVDIVINNAAIRHKTPLLEMSEEEWHRILGVDLHSAFYTAQAFVPGMIDNGWGRIVSMTGMNAMHGYDGRAPVSTAKHGLWGLTKSMAKEFGSQGVTANAISPGPIRPDPPDPSRDAFLAKHVPDVPVGRAGEPMEIAALAAFLCSDDGAYVNAQMIACNGGAQT